MPLDEVRGRTASNRCAIATEDRMRNLTRVFAIAIPFALASCSLQAHALSLSAAAGLDQNAGPNGARSRDAIAVADLGLAAGDVLGGVLRYDDAVLGAGAGVLAGAGVAVAPGTRLRATVIRFLGDTGYRAWRTRVGPRWDVAGRSAALTWQHDEGSGVPRADGAVVEMAAPVAGPLSARAEAAWTGYSDGATSAQASLGAAVALGGHMQLTGSLGMARRTVSSAPPLSGSGDGHGLPLLLAPRATDPTTDPNATPWGPTTAISLRLLLP
jgi:hypothetical protein